MMVQMKEKLKNLSAPLVKIFGSKDCQIFFFFDAFESRENEILRPKLYDCVDQFSENCKWEEKSKTGEGQRIIAVVSKWVKLIATEACLQDTKYRDK